MPHAHATEPLVMIHGADYTFRIQIEELDAPRDITGDDITIAFKLNPWDVTPVFTKTTPTEIVILNQTTNRGQARINIADTDTSSLPNREQILWFDVDLTTAEGALSPLRAEQLIVRPEITP